MRVLFDCTYTRLTPGNVGITRVVRELARALQTMQSVTLSVDLVAWSPEGFRQLPSEDLTPKGATGGPSYAGVVRLLTLIGNPRIRRAIVGLLPLWLQRIIWHWVSRSAYGRAAKQQPLVSYTRDDVLLICDAAWNYDIEAALKQARDQGCRVITMIHDLIPINHPDLCAPLFTRVFRHWLHASLANSDGIVGNSRATCLDVAEYCEHNSLPALKCASFRLGGSLLAPSAQDAAAVIRRLVPAGAEATSFLVVGSIEPRKNHAFIIDAFEQVWLQRPDARLLIIGRPADGTQATIHRILHHPELGSRLFLVTDGSDAELDLAYRQVRALIFASRAEGFGLPLVEARQRGCWVLASDIPAFRELADEGVLLFALNDRQALAEAVMQVLDGNGPPPSTMPAFGWGDSASQLLAGMNEILTASTARQIALQ